MLPTTLYPTGRGTLRSYYREGLLYVINTDGEVIYTGNPTTGNFIWYSGGFPYATLYGDEINWQQASMVQNTWYAISDSDVVDAHTNLITGDGQGKLTVAYAGKYAAWYALTAEMSGADNHLKTTFLVNGSDTPQGEQHLHFPTANTEQAVSCHTILDLAAGQYVQVGVMNPESGTPTVTIDHINMSLLQVGG